MHKNKLLVLFSYPSVYANFSSMSYHYNYLCGMLFLQMKQEQSHHCMYRRLGTLFSQILRERKDKKQVSYCCSYAFQETNSLRRTMQIVECSLLHGRPNAEAPLSQGPWPAFVKTLYILSVRTQTHLPKFPETSLNKGKERYTQSESVIHMP